MRWLKRERGKASIALTGLLLLLILMVWVPVSAAGASERALGLAMPGTGTGTVQATLSVDPTMTALQKEQLTLQDDKLKNDNVWAWLSPVSTILGPLATIGTILVGVLVARNNFLQWSKTREDEQRRREDDQRIEREKRAEDQRVEREKRDEERFQQAVRDLSSQNETAKSGAAIVLRTFLGPKYKQFYEQVFELTVAHLQFSTPPDPNAPVTLSPLRRALTVTFRDAFPQARNYLKSRPLSLDATRIQLDRMNLAGADLMHAWMPEAYLVETNLDNANLTHTNLKGANLTQASLVTATLTNVTLNKAALTNAILEGAEMSDALLEGADLSGANCTRATLTHASLTEGANLTNTNFTEATLTRADLSRAILVHTDFTGATLDEADFTEANLSQTNLEAAASLHNTRISNTTGLAQQRRDECARKGAII